MSLPEDTSFNDEALFGSGCYGNNNQPCDGSTAPDQMKCDGELALQLQFQLNNDLPSNIPSGDFPQLIRSPERNASDLDLGPLDIDCPPLSPGAGRPELTPGGEGSVSTECGQPSQFVPTQAVAASNIRIGSVRDRPQIPVLLDCTQVRSPYSGRRLLRERSETGEGGQEIPRDVHPDQTLHETGLIDLPLQYTCQDLKENIAPNTSRKQEKTHTSKQRNSTMKSKSSPKRGSSEGDRDPCFAPVLQVKRYENTSQEVSKTGPRIVPTPESLRCANDSPEPVQTAVGETGDQCEYPTPDLGAFCPHTDLLNSRTVENVIHALETERATQNSEEAVVTPVAICQESDDRSLDSSSDFTAVKRIDSDPEDLEADSIGSNLSIGSINTDLSDVTSRLNMVSLGSDSRPRISPETVDPGMSDQDSNGSFSPIHPEGYVLGGTPGQDRYHFQPNTHIEAAPTYHARGPFSGTVYDMSSRSGQGTQGDREARRLQSQIFEEFSDIEPSSNMHHPRWPSDSRNVERRNVSSRHQTPVGNKNSQPKRIKEKRNESSRASNSFHNNVVRGETAERTNDTAHDNLLLSAEPSWSERSPAAAADSNNVGGRSGTRNRPRNTHRVRHVPEPVRQYGARECHPESLAESPDTQGQINDNRSYSNYDTLIGSQETTPHISPQLHPHWNPSIQGYSAVTTPHSADNSIEAVRTVATSHQFGSPMEVPYFAAAARVPSAGLSSIERLMMEGVNNEEFQCREDETVAQQMTREQARRQLEEDERLARELQERFNRQDPVEQDDRGSPERRLEFRSRGVRNRMRPGLDSWSASPWQPGNDRQMPHTQQVNVADSRRANNIYGIRRPHSSVLQLRGDSNRAGEDGNAYDLLPDWFQAERDPDYMVDPDHGDSYVSMMRDPHLMTSFLRNRAPGILIPDNIDLNDYEALWELAEGLGEVHRVGLDDHELQYLQGKHVYNARQSEDKENCAICLNALVPGETVRTLPSCMHQYHLDCIDTWLKRNAQCPVCRESVEVHMF